MRKDSVNGAGTRSAYRTRMDVRSVGQKSLDQHYPPLAEDKHRLPVNRNGTAIATIILGIIILMLYGTWYIL